MPSIITFGKHKGTDIVEVAATDPQYIDWLMAQSWFSKKHTAIYQIIVNNFREPAETPEHNAMQAIFLDDAFCETFARSLWPSDVDNQLREKVVEKYTCKHYDEIEEIPNDKYREIRSKSDRLESNVQRSQSDLEYAEQTASLNDAEIVKRSPYGYGGYSGQDEADPGIMRTKWREKVARCRGALQNSVAQQNEHRAKVEHLKAELAAVTASCVDITFIIERCEFEPIDVVLQGAMSES